MLILLSVPFFRSYQGLRFFILLLLLLVSLLLLLLLLLLDSLQICRQHTFFPFSGFLVYFQIARCVFKQIFTVLIQMGLNLNFIFHKIWTSAAKSQCFLFSFIFILSPPAPHNFSDGYYLGANRCLHCIKVKHLSNQHLYHQNHFLWFSCI